jgi:hypothetical protein
MPARRVKRDVHEAARDVARTLAKTPAFAQSRRDRKKVEMLPAERQEGARRLISHPYCASCPPPHVSVHRPAVACPRAAHKSETHRSLRSLQVAGAVGRHNNTLSRVAFGSGAVSTRSVAARASCGASSHRKGKSHASSFNSTGRVGDSSPTRNSCRCRRIYGYRVFLGRLDDWRHRQQTCGRAG